MPIPQLVPTSSQHATYGGVSFQIMGELVPVLHVDLSAMPIYFEHHILLWKDPRLTIEIKPLKLVVSGSVAPNFSFSLSANADTVPKVDPTTIQTSTGVTMTVGTNSPLGYTAYVKSANAALTSASSPSTPISSGTFNGSPDSLTAGSTNYGLVPSTGAACGTCTGSLIYDGEYNVTLGTQAGAFNSTNFSSFVSSSIKPRRTQRARNRLNRWLKLTPPHSPS